MIWEGAIAFFGLLLLLAIVPGPTDAMVVAQAVRRGYGAAWGVIVGVVLADWLMIALVLVGFEVWVDFFELHQRFLVWISALLLTGLAISIFRSAGRTETEAEPAGNGGVRSGLAGGFLVTFVDPEALAFYCGVLPTFVSPGEVGLGETVFLGGVVSVLICGVKGTYAWLAVHGIRSKMAPRTQKTVLRGVALVMLAMAGWIILR
ncbi:LysE family translocator [Puniceicoccus vermicola]|uniref:LysE family translocator n=1 Tax=Puniceicoccus vermicola TaxID=388746 RepID=A0A7X1E653_9BACT|nr:LysE family translocator [Puniceicoccus vermicola]MBC2602302.1 LysE family translocator [Puniceicoccus vermicola]